MADTPGVKVTRGNFVAIQQAVLQLAEKEVLVGIPDETTDRDDGPMTSAALAYIHDQGAPEANIPARPFMLPGIRSVEKPVEKHLSNALKATMRGNAHAAEQQLIQAGLDAVSGIMSKIDEGIPPPLAERTLRERAARGRKGAQEELDNRAKGLAPSTDLAKPLVDTGEMRKSIKYVIRPRRARR